MKLAEALNQRADLQKRIAQLKERLSNNVKVQEGDQPAENPEDLFSELSNSLKELETIIVRINKTNQETRWNGNDCRERRPLHASFHPPVSTRRRQCPERPLLPQRDQVRPDHRRQPASEAG